MSTPPLRLAAQRPTPERRFRIVQTLGCLNVDIVAGLLAAAAFAASATRTRPPLAWWIALPAATWVIYSLDRILDARATPGPARAARRRFYQVHRHRLSALTAAVAVVALVAGFSLPTSMVAPGLAVAALAVAHLALAQRGTSLPKECSAALIYVAGVWFGPIVLAGGADRFTLAIVAMHFAAALGNLGAFSLIERGSDEADRQLSSVHRWGERPVRTAIRLLAVTGTGVGVVVLAAGPGRLAPHALVLLPLLWLPVALDAMRGALAGGEGHRLGDLAFLLLALPALLAS